MLIKRGTALLIKETTLTGDPRSYYLRVSNLVGLKAAILTESVKAQIS